MLNGSRKKPRQAKASNRDWVELCNDVEDSSESGVPATFTTPIYPYPLSAKYEGSGDPNDDANFEVVEP